MKERLDAASAAFQPYRFANANDPIRRARLEALNTAQSQYDGAVKHLSYVYDLQAAQANLEKALQDYDETAGGAEPDALALAQAELSNAEAQLALAQQDLDEAAARSVMNAPLDGVVLSVEAAPGALLGAGTPVFTLLDAAALEFHTTNLSERDLALIVPGQRALVTLKAYPDPHRGHGAAHRLAGRRPGGRRRHLPDHPGAQPERAGIEAGDDRAGGD